MYVYIYSVYAHKSKTKNQVFLFDGQNRLKKHTKN